MSGHAPAPDAASQGSATRLPRLRRRRRVLVGAVCVAFALGVLGVSADARRILADATGGVPSPEGAALSAPVYAYDFGGTGDVPLERPVGIRVFDGRAYVADSLAGHIRVFREGGAAEDVIGEERLAVPVYLAIDGASGELLVTDRSLRALLAFGLDGSFVETITPEGRSAEETAAAEVWAPIAVAYADDGSIYVTDVEGEHRVWHLSRSGEVLGVHPPVQRAEESTPTLAFDFPNAVVASGGRVWVADSNNRRLVELNPVGEVVRSVPLGRLIRGLAMLESGESGEADEAATRPHFALIDAFSHEVVLVSDAGSEVGRVGGLGTGDGGLSFPNDVAVTRTALFVADTGNARIQVYEWPGARGLAALVWEGGPSWLGLLSGPLLLTPLALAWLARPVRVVASREALEELRAAVDPEWEWRRVRLVVTPAVAKRAPRRPGPRAEVSEFSHPDVAAIAREYELGDTNSETLSLALRHRILLTGDPMLATVSGARGVELLDVAGFVGEFALPPRESRADRPRRTPRRDSKTSRRTGRGTRR